MTPTRTVQHSTNGSGLAEILDRVLDRGVVIAGDIKVKIVDIELLTVQIRLVICSVERAKEIGVDWWVDHPAFSRRPAPALTTPDTMTAFAERLARLEAVAAVPEKPVETSP